jgi:hypothetical protein
VQQHVQQQRSKVQDLANSRGSLNQILKLKCRGEVNLALGPERRAIGIGDDGRKKAEDAKPKSKPKSKPEPEPAGVATAPTAPFSRLV